MGQELSLFSNYSGENAVTNYCGLILKLLYERKPQYLEEFLVSTVQGNPTIQIGPKFFQQTREKESIPDLSISQSSISIFFETKLTNWFYDEQIESHISGLGDRGETKILFLLSSFQEANYSLQFHGQINAALKKGVLLQPLSFEDFLTAIENACTDSELFPFIQSFRNYLESNDLLPKWRRLLEVVNCVNTMDEVSQGFYACPYTGGAYSHQRARYFGPYADKTVKQIHEISGTVIIYADTGKSEIRWNNLDETDDALVQQARNFIDSSSLRKEQLEECPLQVFILKNPSPTNFIKDSFGGMLQSKRYFWDIAQNLNSSAELAEYLRDKPWSQFE